MKPVCVPCRRFYRVKRQGFYFIEGMPNGKGQGLPGTQEPDSWKPYKLWASDLYECQGCGAQILSGFGQRPIAEHYEDDFARAVSSFGATLQVNDC